MAELKSWLNQLIDFLKDDEPTEEERVEHALAFIEKFEDSGDEYIWLDELKRILKGDKNASS